MKLLSEQKQVLAGDASPAAERRRAMLEGWQAPRSDSLSTSAFPPSCPMTASACHTTNNMQGYHSTDRNKSLTFPDGIGDNISNKCTFINTRTKSACYKVLVVFQQLTIV